MSSPILVFQLFTLLLALTSATPHQVAKRIPQYDLSNLTIQDVCGPSPSDCGEGYCCQAGTECLSPSPPLNQYQCADLLYPTLTIPAVAYSSLISLLDFDGLTSVGLTLSTVLPTTASTSSGFKTYSDNVLPSTSWQTANVDPTVGVTRTSTGAAVRTATAAAAMRVGVGMGVGILVGVGGMV